MSAFSPDNFLSTPISGAMSTEIKPIPEGEYTALIDSVKGRMAGDKPVADVVYIIDNEDVRKATGMQKPQCRQTLWLDLTPAGALDLDEGKNVGLGRLRQAVNQNQPGQQWMPSMLVGQAVKITVKQTMGEGANAGKIYSNVTAVTSL